MWKVVVLLCLFAAPVCAERVRLGDRFYLIDLPATPTGAMILGLHGAGGNPANFARMSGLSAAANAAGYAVIYPAGEGGTWNALYCCGAAFAGKVDDLGFLDGVIADASRRFGLDRGRVYLTGMSNGAMMAETYGAARLGRVQAVAGVSGTLDLTQTPAVALPLLHIHGLSDPVVPYAGGQNARETADFTAVPTEIAAFVAAFGGLTKTTQQIDLVDDGMSVTQVDYSDHDGVAQVRLFTIKGGKHAWPGGDGAKRGISRDISATEQVLAFFALHP